MQQEGEVIADAFRLAHHGRANCPRRRSRGSSVNWTATCPSQRSVVKQRARKQPSDRNACMQAADFLWRSGTPARRHRDSRRPGRMRSRNEPTRSAFAWPSRATANVLRLSSARMRLVLARTDSGRVAVYALKRLLASQFFLERTLGSVRCRVALRCDRY